MVLCVLSLLFLLLDMLFLPFLRLFLLLEMFYMLLLLHMLLLLLLLHMRGLIRASRNDESISIHPYILYQTGDCVLIRVIRGG